MPRAPAFRRIVLGIDGSRHARRAVAFLARLAPGPRGRVTVVRVIEPLRTPSLALMPASARARIADELARLDRVEQAQAQRSLDAAKAALTKAGWRVRTSLRSGVPVRELLAAADEARADLLVLGGRGTGGLERLLLGSVAEGCVKRASMPVLICR